VDRIDAAVGVDLRLDTREAICMSMTYVTVQNFLLTNFTSGDFLVRPPRAPGSGNRHRRVAKRTHLTDQQLQKTSTKWIREVIEPLRGIEPPKPDEADYPGRLN